MHLKDYNIVYIIVPILYSIHYYTVQRFKWNISKI